MSSYAYRKKINLNRKWKFFRGDWNGYQSNGPEHFEFDDSSWCHIGLPHSFNIPYLMENDWYVGEGWYRKYVRYSPDWNRKIIHLEFDGVFQVAEVFVNGSLVDIHEGGYTGFHVNITSFLHPGNNVIAIRVNNEWSGQLAPRSGEHSLSGGIYRDVSLTITDPVHITWYGNFVSTSLLTQIEDDVQMQVHLRTEIHNCKDTTTEVTLRTNIIDDRGQVLTRMYRTHIIEPGSIDVLDAFSEPVLNPRLWCIEDPYLYRIVCEVEADGVVTDRLEDTMGFRWIEWTSDYGFFLNGQHVYLNGAYVYQEQAGWGDAITQAAIYREVRKIKKQGINLIHGNQYPCHPALARACDHYGILFCSEASILGMGDDASESGFEQSAITQLREMIRINRNRPSIILWSMSNMRFFSDNSVKEKAMALIRKMVDVSREEDPTRKAAAMDSQRWRLDKPNEGRIEPSMTQSGVPVQLNLYTGAGSHTIVATDGTDDTQIMIELVDVDGRRVDSAVEVTLTIISGPGQFPARNPKVISTDNGLEMIEGVGVVTFRSYYAGNTIIEATSPDVRSAVLYITSVGNDASTEPDMTIPSVKRVNPSAATTPANVRIIR